MIPLAEILSSLNESAASFFTVTAAVTATIMTAKAITPRAAMKSWNLLILSVTKISKEKVVEVIQIVVVVIIIGRS